jgi:uncharacterized protein
LSDLRRTPRRFAGPVMQALDALRWLTSRVWPGRAFYAWWLARRGLQLVRVDVPVAGLPLALDGLRLVQLSDLHVGCFLDEASLQPVVDLARACEPDVLLLTGDFITHTTRDIHELGIALARIDAPLGKFAVFGNHDYRGRRERELIAALRRQGVAVLRNATARVERGGAVVGISGLEDLEESKGSDLDAALAGLHGDEAVRVLLCHHPDVIDALPPGRFDLVLSGHTHGGQIALPGLTALAARFTSRHLRGDYPVPGGGLLHVHRGIGVLVVPFRFRARAEVACLTLRAVPDARVQDTQAHGARESAA